MPQSEWGSKHTCQDCNAKYYDMGRDPILCPLCGALLVEKPILARAVQGLPKDLKQKEVAKEEQKNKEADLSSDDEDILVDDAVLPELDDEEDVEADDVPDVSDENDEEISSVIDETKVSTESS